jgi:hypothetical protein
MGQAVTHDERAVSAARYWASRPGNWMVSAVFDRDDAQQEAAMALLADPDTKPRALYRRVLDAVDSVIPGYRQRKLWEFVPLTLLDSEVDRDKEDELFLRERLAVECDAERLTLLHERLRILDALPDEKRQIVVHWLSGDDDEQAGKAHGMTGAGWRWHRKRLFKSLQRRGL